MRREYFLLVSNHPIKLATAPGRELTSLSIMYALYQTNEVGTFELKFTYTFGTAKSIYIATCPPYTLSQITSDINEMEKKYIDHPNVYFCKELIANSLDGRNIDLITISSKKGISDEKEKRSESKYPPQALKSIINQIP